MPDAPQAEAPAKTQLPLSRIPVLDLTLARAGPTAVRHLADWGAEVIRVEPPQPPGVTDDAHVFGGHRNSDYQNLHRNKRSMQLDLKNPAGRGVLLDLIKAADVVVENMRPSV